MNDLYTILILIFSILLLIQIVGLIKSVIKLIFAIKKHKENIKCVTL